MRLVRSKYKGEVEPSSNSQSQRENGVPSGTGRLRRKADSAVFTSCGGVGRGLPGETCRKAPPTLATFCIPQKEWDPDHLEAHGLQPHISFYLSHLK